MNRVLLKFTALTLWSFSLVATSQQPAEAAKGANFEVASVRIADSGRSCSETSSSGCTRISPAGNSDFTARNISLPLLISIAFGVDSRLVTGGPGWFDDTSYDVVAKSAGGASISSEARRPMLQALLKERFGLMVHLQHRQVPGYWLIVGKGGTKLKITSETNANAYILPDRIVANSATMKTLASMLARPTGKPVVDRTELAGIFDITLTYSPEGAADSDLPSIFAAIQEQLGLRLEPESVSQDFIVIDQVNRVPTEN